MIVTTLLALSLTIASEAKSEAPKNYTFDTSATSKQVQAGKSGTLQIHIRATEGHYISPEAPLKIGLLAEGLELEKKQLGHADAKEKKAKAPEFTVAFKAPQAGDKAIAVDAMFFVCSEKICERKTEKVNIPVAVRP